MGENRPRPVAPGAQQVIVLSRLPSQGEASVAPIEVESSPAEGLGEAGWASAPAIPRAAPIIEDDT